MPADALALTLGAAVLHASWNVFLRGSLRSCARRSPAPEVASVRETSIVLATLLAAVILRERVGLRRLVGAVVLTGGVALIALA